MKWIRSLYDWTIAQAQRKHAVWTLAGVSFAESSFFPIPPDVVLIPMCLANRKKAFFYATVCTISSVAGGVLGYAIGYYLYETIGARIIEFYGMLNQFDELQAKYDQWGGWIIFAKGLTPFPYKVITIISGVLHMNMGIFILSSILARSLRFYLVAGLLWKFGAPIQTFIEKHLMPLCVLFLIFLIGGFASLKYII